MADKSRDRKAVVALAHKLGCTCIPDVDDSADGRIVVYHDDTCPLAAADSPASGAASS